MKALLIAALLALGAPVHAQLLKNTNCATHPVETNRIECDLVASDTPIGVGVPPGQYVTFTNRTAGYLQINQAHAVTGEQRMWSEYCVLHQQFVTGQSAANVGEVGCAAKQIGENYPVITFGAGTGFSVAPGAKIIMNSGSDPDKTNHNFALWVAHQTTGLHSWRQPAMDTINHCSGQSQATPWTPWQNTTGGDLHVTGAFVYSESANSWAKNTVSGAACVYVLKADGTPKYANCDDALRSRGEVPMQMQVVAAGEWVGAQAVNACASGGLWDWAAFIHIW